MKIIVIYDNSVPKSEIITDVIGRKGFGDVVVKKQRIEDYTYNSVLSIFKTFEWKKINSVFEYSEIIDYIKSLNESDIRILHIFSNYFIKNINDVSLSYKKLLYIDEPYKALFDRKIASILFSDIKSYSIFCKNITLGQDISEASDFIKSSFDVEGLTDLSLINNFIHCITGNFDARYFNSLKESEYTITKTSTDKLKIKKEYTYYQLLPEDMKSWFVMPYNYHESNETAEYTMERLYMTDLAIKYVHGSIDKDEFNTLLNKYFYFFKSRHSRPTSDENYNNTAKKLYVDKVNERIESLKNHPKFDQINNYLKANNLNLDDILSKYYKLKEEIESKNNYPKIDVIGHGDPGFANTLYNKATQTLKFIDPKGALKEEELWTNPYYDIAKLSHCVCGRYDFFNNGLFEIKINNSLAYELDIPFNNEMYKAIFKEKIVNNGYDYHTVRIYEASLFLSMLPLHIDNPYKVFGFILNTIEILKELENDV
ncbi:MAG: hypothetical protein ACI37S_06770 [Candidatus Gastranaerophilaceae bacterium]